MGEFRFDKDDINKLTRVKPDRNDKGFQFSIATDFRQLPFSDSYLTMVENYQCSANYSIEEIKKISGSLKNDVYADRDTTKHPVCVINYLTDNAKLQKMSDPWEIKGWRYEYVINKKTKNEFLYSSVDGRIKRVWQKKKNVVSP